MVRSFSANATRVQRAHEREKGVRYAIESHVFSGVICDEQKQKTGICGLSGVLRLRSLRHTAQNLAPGGAPHAHGGAARMTSTMFARTRAAPSRLGSLSAPARAHRGVRAAAATANGAGAAGTKLDALIIGGGPAGLSTALMLKQRGCEQADTSKPKGRGVNLFRATSC